MTSKEILRTKYAMAQELADTVCSRILERKEAHNTLIRSRIYDDVDEPEYHADEFWSSLHKSFYLLPMLVSAITDDNPKLTKEMRDIVTQIADTMETARRRAYDLEQWDGYFE